MRDANKPETSIEERQDRERAYHEAYAAINNKKRSERVALNVISSGPRRPWNAYWQTYDLLMSTNIKGSRILVPGCGFGEDAIRLAKLGGIVYACDLSEDVLNIARERAKLMSTSDIHFEVMPAESMKYENCFFDLVFFNDILHHVNIPATLREIQRVLKPNGVIVANELYTHSRMQRIRESRIVNNFLYHRMVRFIYGSDIPYITQDEHKIDEHELAQLESYLQSGFVVKYFLVFGGRIFPANWKFVARLDLVLLNILGPLGRYLAGRVVIKGNLR